jgi:hypothetical protein
MDRSSQPRRLRRPTLQVVVEEIEWLRRQHWTGKQIAEGRPGTSRKDDRRVLNAPGRAHDQDPRARRSEMVACATS